MKILTWNVNGLKACLKKGFIDIIMGIKADVICLQETKLQEEIPLDIPYHKYWAFAQRIGYSGTAIFSRYNPLSIKYGLGIEEFDNEGRVITIEYKYYFVVNVYVPNSQGKLERRFYRDRFDIALQDFVNQLQKVKPVIICGDFNVAHKEIDIYPENEMNEILSKGFDTQERNNFTELLGFGFVDAFRNKYPDTIEYSWWSNRLGKRFENKGWRIDYFLLSEKIKDYVSHIKYLSKYFGSDHCPLLLDINHTKIGVDKLNDVELETMWNSIDWVKAEDELLDMQQKLTKAAFTNNQHRRIQMQERIVNSKSAKVLAVRHINYP